MTQEPKNMSDEKLKAYCNKCGHYGPVTADGEHLRPSDGERCNYVAMPSPTPTAEKADVVEAVAADDDLARLIETRLLGVAPDDQDLQLEDHDWRRIIAALQSIPDNPLEIAAGIRDAALAAEPAGDDDGPCTDCDDTGITIQTERRCSCDAAEPVGEEPLVWSIRRKGTHEMVWDDGGFIASSKEEAEHFAGYFVNHEAFPLYAHPAQSNLDGLVEALRLIEQTAETHYTARNGRRCSIEGSDGEMCSIIPFDTMEEVRTVLAALSAPALDTGDGE